ncbi:hypothetical protein LN42_05675 [Marinitoga sp. 1137]|uniref:radical SAM protein n=1 Tax=Marinitoga sp. 1137 TaxID=1545835 RepID=UPI0009509587|nr:radical SAM protein [Marinitoga sp. 1137]APT75924.1 hypothetical protein LN42_05675 [Marinitoga sp. 1137]
MIKIDDVIWTLTEKCDGKCVHCGLWKKRINYNDELDLDIIENIVSNSLLKNLIQAHITGGEPHISPKYIPLIELLVKYHPSIRIHSPISGMYPMHHYAISKYVLKITKNYLIDVSIDGPEEINDKLRGKGMFENAVKTISLLKKLDLKRLRMQFTVYPENYEYIEWAKNFSEKLGVGLYINFGRVSVRFGKDEEKDTDEFSFSIDQINKIDELLRKIDYDKGPYKWRYIWQMKWWRGEKFTYDCYMGFRSVDIDPYGNVYPCLLWKKELYMGNLRDFNGDLRALYQSPKAQEVLKYIKEKRCQPCSFSCAIKASIDGNKGIEFNPN